MNETAATIQDIKSSFNWRSRDDWEKIHESDKTVEVKHPFAEHFSAFMSGPTGVIFRILDGKISQESVAAYTTEVDVQNDATAFLATIDPKRDVLYTIRRKYVKQGDGSFREFAIVRYAKANHDII